jgi:o-succinylbenzoate---CoA ligase
MKPPASITCPLAVLARKRPDAPAIITPEGVFSYTRYAHEAGALEAVLREEDGGVIPFLPDRHAPEHGGFPPAPAIFMALFRAGKIAFPLNPVFPEDYRNTILAKQADTGALLRETAEKRTDAQEEASLRIRLDQPASLILTSGSTGLPKAALHAWGNHYHNARLSQQRIPFGTGDRWLLSLGMHHVAGLAILFRALAGGGAVIFAGRGERLAESILRYEATHISLVAAQFRRLLENAEGLRALKRMKTILLGGGPIPEELLCRAHELRLRVACSYGMTETASQAATTLPGAGIEELLTAGRPLAENTLRIAGDGEIQARGACLFSGYREGGTITRPMTPDGWFETGDLGHFDSAGRLLVSGRKDNRFISGGENIQPEAIEAALRNCAGVEDALVTPQPDEEWGFVAAAFVRMAGNAPLEPADLEKELAGRLPRFMLPRRWLPWPEEKDGSLKPSRTAFAARARKTDSE